MSIQNKLFKATTSFIHSDSDVKELKSHVNQVNSSFFGNELNPSKNNAYITKLLGFKNSNVLSAVTSSNISNHKDFSGFIADNMESLFSDFAIKFVVGDTPVFHVPVIKYKVKEVDTGAKRTFFAMLEVYMSDFDDEDITKITHTLFLYDADEEDFIDIPANWDLESDDITDIIENCIDIGIVQGMSVTDEAKSLLGFDNDKAFKDHMLINDVSASLAKEISSIAKSLTGVSPTMRYESMNSSTEGNLFHLYVINFNKMEC